LDFESQIEFRAPYGARMIVHSILNRFRRRTIRNAPPTRSALTIRNPKSEIRN
jgi:hypothetical protein